MRPVARVEVGINGRIAGRSAPTRPPVAASVAPGPHDEHTSVVTVARAWPISAPRPLQLALAQLAVTVVLMGVIILAFVDASESPEPLWPHVLNLLVGWLYVAAGLFAWSRRPSNRFGFLIVGGGLAIVLADLAATGVPMLIAASSIVATLPLALLVHVLHAFPSGRLLTRSSRLVVLGVYAVSLVLQAPLYLFTAQPGLSDVLLLADRPDLATLGHRVQAGAGCVAQMFAGGGYWRRCTATASWSCCSFRSVRTCSPPCSG